MTKKICNEKVLKKKILFQEFANSSSNDPDNNTCKSTCSLVLSTCSDLLHELGDTLKKNHSQLQADEVIVFVCVCFKVFKNK